MPFPMKIQPIDPLYVSKGSIRTDPVTKPVMKSRLKRLFERQFPSVLRTSLTEKLGGGGAGEQQHLIRDGNSGGGGGVSGSDFEPSSLCLANMVQNFIEESNEKQSTTKCGRNRCNCFNGNCSDDSDDEFEFLGSTSDGPSAPSAREACKILKSLVPCASVSERNLLADTAKIVEKNKNGKNKDDCRRIVIDGLSSQGYDASICKSRWEKSPSVPAGEYEYIDVIVEGERLLIDIDFRSEFEIARSTSCYRVILQSLPSIFVGKPDRVQQIVAVVSEAAKQSLKKKGLYFPPWRKPEYMRAKWLAPYQRMKPVQDRIEIENKNKNSPCLIEEIEIENKNKNSPCLIEEIEIENKNSIRPVQDRIEIEIEIENKNKNSPCLIETQNFSGDFELNKDKNSPCLIETQSFSGEFGLIFGEKNLDSIGEKDPVGGASEPAANSGRGEEKITVMISPWQPPAIKPRVSGAKVVAGLASVLRENPNI